MQLRIEPASGPFELPEIAVPGDKSIAHRWIILAATADGSSRLVEVPASLDVRSTAACLAALSPKARAGLHLWARNAPAAVEGGGSTWNVGSRTRPIEGVLPVLEVEGDGRSSLQQPADALDCGNSGTTMRLLAGVVAAAPFRTVLTGDASLNARPMERVAAPLRAMGATVATIDGHAPVTIDGGVLRGVRHDLPVASAQVKSAVVLAALAAEGETTVAERAPTRDHTERALVALGAPLRTDGRTITVSRFQHRGFRARVPGDPSSAAFLLAAAALAGSPLRVVDVGVNPTRTRYLEVMRRMGLGITVDVERDELGEPVGSIAVEPATSLGPVRVEPDELPRVIDEVPVLAAIAAHATGPSWFAGAGELRVKESDRLVGLATGLEALGHHAAVEGDDLVLGGGGLGGGRVASNGDHRMAMAFAVTALRADAPVVVDGIEAAAVSFPGFAGALRALGCTVEELDP